MKALSITGNELKRLIIAGANNLQRNKDLVDELNVFPVPDGDTGTNMSLTVLSAAREVEKATSNVLYDVAKAAANGSLRGARGNSGVILSQLFRGFAKGLEGHNELTSSVLANAFKQASETAYKAVMKPKEGTILTVAREMGEKAVQIQSQYEDIEVLFEKIIQYGNEVLKKTPDMLPVLKQAGVVDAGGKGLLFILEGAYNALSSNDLDIEISPLGEEKEQNLGNNTFSQFKTEDIAFGYCTEFIINVSKVENSLLDNLKVYLESIGDSIVVVGDDDLVKVHVHTDHPGQALEKALSIGSLTNMKIENMREQHTHNLIKYDQVEARNDESASLNDNVLNVQTKEYGFVAVAAGEGLVEIFKKMGVDFVIHGGQTMNPSTEDFLNAINQIPANNIFIMPNNKNIILAAEQAKELTDKSIYVIPTISIPQGLTAMIHFDFNKNAQDNFKVMTDSLSTVRTGQVTFAVRDTTIDDIEIKTNDIMGILENRIQVVTQSIEDTTKKLLDEIVTEDTEIISIYYGKDIEKEAVEQLQEYIENNYDHCEVEVHQGGQPLYYYIISAE